IVGYWRRWSVEVAYGAGQHMLGFHEPMVWCAARVARAHPLAWCAGSLVVLWDAQSGQDQPAAQRQRPWDPHKVEPTFGDMLACARLHWWTNWRKKAPARSAERLAWLREYLATAAGAPAPGPGPRHITAAMDARPVRHGAPCGSLTGHWNLQNSNLKRSLA